MNSAPVGQVVLYIEDNADNVRLVQRQLMRRPGTELHSAGNARDGLRAAIEDRPDLILLDNRLPDGTGEQVLRQLAAEPVTAGIPVLILSGDSDRATVDALLALGASDFLAKPFDIHQLLSMLDRYLG
jgi:CheY-like chemotaxis protein